MDAQMIGLIKALGGSGGGSGGVSSWNDLTDRPFYSGGMVDVVLFENTTLTDQGDGTYGAAPESEVDVSGYTEGSGVKVVVDGVTYNVTVTTYQGMPVCGNLGLFGVGENTGEPFILIFQGGVYYQLMVFGSGEGETHTASVYGVVENIQKLDEKYLPGTLLPDTVERGKFVATGPGGEWRLCNNPAIPQLISEKEVEYGTSEVSFTLDKPYKKVYIHILNPHVSGTAAKDIEVNATYGGTKFGIGSLKQAATPKGAGDFWSFMNLERNPYMGWVVTTPEEPLVFGSYNREATPVNMVTTISPLPTFCQTDGSGYESSVLSLKIADDTFVSDSIFTKVWLYGILDYDTML